jgi:hypothetical protein
MSKYRETTIQKGNLIKKAVVEILDDEPKVQKKFQYRKAITEEVFDLHDSVADNAKMISLMISLFKRLYEVNFNKDNLADADKAVADYVFQRFGEIKTRADVQFQKEGPAMIDKLLNRQGKIGEIISK